MPAGETGWPHRDVARILGYASIYVLIGALSLLTAYVQTNTAAVWMPAGYAAGILILRGRRMWPAVTLGAFLLNLGDNLAVTQLSLPSAVAVALAIALGNTAEALSAHAIASRRAGGAALLDQPRHLAAFATFVAPLPPIVSACVGVAVSHVAGLPAANETVEVLLTWYLADALGILIVAPLTIALPTIGRPDVSGRRLVEFVALIAALLFAGQTMSGRYLTPILQDWSRPYMTMPLLLWATFRFSSSGAMLAIVLVASGSIIGTALGHAAFPNSTASRSLLSLQIFLGLVSITTLMISAALARLAELQNSLKRGVTDRTIEIERLQRERELMNSLVVHDLKSPLYGVRNALRALADALSDDRVNAPTAVAALKIMDETCSSLAERVSNLLASEIKEPTALQLEGELLSTVVARVVSSYGPIASRVRLQCAPGLLVRQSAQVERILDGLLSNAIKHGPPNAPICVTAFVHQRQTEIYLGDTGEGIASSKLADLFKWKNSTRPGDSDVQGGLGLYLASELADTVGGRLTYLTSAPTTTFRLVLPG